MDKSKPLPPDAALQSLASLVNVRLSGASVNFYRIQRPERVDTGIIYSCGVRRANVVTQAMLNAADADEIVLSANQWVAELRPESKWTSDPSEAA